MSRARPSRHYRDPPDSEHALLLAGTPLHIPAIATAPWTLSDFDFAAQPGVDEKLIRDLATLRFLDDASNVLFVGPPG
uniref:ATP-binding protein n=1 Tax=Amycolatopsis sp. cmx-8-4 TaxID=2790947 RepID=UPI00397BA286